MDRDGAGSAPSVSVVVPTHDRVDLCRAACDSLETAIDGYEGDVSVTVVNSASERVTDGDDERFEEISVRRDRSAAEKRNIGWRSAESEWVAFMDDDCTVDPDTFEILREYLADASGDVGGFYPVTEFSGDTELGFEACEGTFFTNLFRFASRREELDWGPLTFAVFRRSALESVDGIDESFEVSGEDVDLGASIRRAGYRLRGIPDTIAYHTTSTWNSVRGNANRFYAYGYGEGDLKRKHRSQRYLQFNKLPSIALAVLVSALVLWVAVTPAAGVLFVASYGLAGQLLSYRFYDRLCDKSPRELTVLRLYVYAFELGDTVSSIRSGPVTNAFRSFEAFDWGTEGSSPSGRERWVYPDETPQLKAMALAYAVVLFAAVVAGVERSI
ncbi:glycosyltransferase family 2 protein [Halosimplex marinum]|uniref:glycosyltransferase family 2 protein n=1 Tax=Halosimplex marinum TaxID=3396620 RepID=UPI003F566B24